MRAYFMQAILILNPRKKLQSDYEKIDLRQIQMIEKKITIFIVPYALKNLNVQILEKGLRI